MPSDMFTISLPPSPYFVAILVQTDENNLFAAMFAILAIVAITSFGLGMFTMFKVMQYVIASQRPPAAPAASPPAAPAASPKPDPSTSFRSAAPLRRTVMTQGPVSYTVTLHLQKQEFKPVKLLEGVWVSSYHSAGTTDAP